MCRWNNGILPHVKRVLILTYYWPPAGGAGVQRWLKHSRYLRDFDWEPVVYTASNPDLSVADEGLLRDVPDGLEVWSTPVREPYDLYRRLTGAAEKAPVGHGFSGGSKGWKQRMGMWVRANLFIPDAKMLWIKPSVNFLVKKLASDPVDLIISTGPPHTMHMIARQLRDRTGIRWLADFRDPWTNNDFYNRLPLTSWADNQHRKLEEQVLRSADAVVTVSPTWAEEFAQLAERKVEVVTNGFDEQDMTTKTSISREQFIIHHIGSMYEDRNPSSLWQALAELASEDDTFRRLLNVKLTGNTEASVIESIHRFGLVEQLEVSPYQAHEKVTAEMGSAALLLLLLNDSPDIEGRIPGKLFEYLAAGRPILCIGSKTGDSAGIIRETGTGTSHDFTEQDAIKQTIFGYYQAWRTGNEHRNTGDISRYSRRECTGRIAAIMDQTIV